MDLHRPEVIVANILERNRHDLRHSIDSNVPKELQPKARCKVVVLIDAAAFLVNRTRPKRVVEMLRGPGSRMQRPGDELPEWVEILEHGSVRIIIMRRGVMHVRG